LSKLKTFNSLDAAIIKLRECVLANYNAANHQAGERAKRDIYPARYDQSAINNIAEQVNGGGAFTDRQQELAIKLVTKYRRQWKKLGYDVSNIDLNTPVLRPIRRDIDRDHKVYVENNRIIIKFPYKPKLISIIADYGNRSFGRANWDKENKIWSFTITPSNVYWVTKFASDHKFAVEESFNKLCEQVEQAYDFKDIRLDIIDKQLVLHDAPETMLDWIHENVGLVEMKNLIKLASLSHVLSYTLTRNLVEYTIRNYPNLYRQILKERSHINPEVEPLRELLLKVNQLGFDNVVFFVIDTEIGELCRAIENLMPDYNITTTLATKLEIESHTHYQKHNWSHSPHKKKEVIITNKTLPMRPDLIISFAGFMAGPSRRDWFGLASKLIYYCRDIDSKIKKIIKKDESNINDKG